MEIPQLACNILHIVVNRTVNNVLQTVFAVFKHFTNTLGNFTPFKMSIFAFRKCSITDSNRNSRIIRPACHKCGTAEIGRCVLVSSAVLTKFLTEKFSVFGYALAFLELCNNSFKASRLGTSSTQDVIYHIHCGSSMGYCNIHRLCSCFLFCLLYGNRLSEKCELFSLCVKWFGFSKNRLGNFKCLFGNKLKACLCDSFLPLAFGRIVYFLLDVIINKRN